MSQSQAQALVSLATYSYARQHPLSSYRDLLTFYARISCVLTAGWLIEKIMREKLEEVFRE